jgi:AcrR family transcriptional regulator
MSPKPADPAVRLALIEAAANLIASEGPGRLTLRRLAHEVGTSTMAVYTHFGGMDELRREVRREGFARLGQHLSGVVLTEDPIADLGLLGAAYYINAITNPNLYRAMFMEGPVGEADAAVGLETFDQLVTAVQRCIEAGRFDPNGDAVAMATQLWALSHGVVTLELAHLLQAEQAQECLRVGANNLFLAFGDDPHALARSIGGGARDDVGRG